MVLLPQVIPGFMAQGGDVTREDGTGGMSIYGDKFDDEALSGRHNRAGVLSMANSGRNTNNSQVPLCSLLFQKCEASCLQRCCPRPYWLCQTLILELGALPSELFKDADRDGVARTRRCWIIPRAVLHHAGALPVARRQARRVRSRHERHGRCEGRRRARVTPSPLFLFEVFRAPYC